MARWLLKTEPTAYSFQRLVADGATVWDGIKNNLALIHLRAMRKGDEALVYHTGDERACVGIAALATDARPDPKLKDPKLVVVDLRPVRALARPVTLEMMKANPKLRGLELLRITRLSVVPVSDAHWAAILAMEKAR